MIDESTLKIAQKTVEFLDHEGLSLVTAESCTGGLISGCLALIPDSGQVLVGGFSVYSPAAKIHMLGVSRQILDEHNLTSEPVACEMARAALKHAPANTAVAVTGLIGEESKDGIEPGTVCFAWAFQSGTEPVLHSQTVRFEGSRSCMMRQAVEHALSRLTDLYTHPGDA